MNPFPCLIRSVSPSGEARYALGEPLVDGYLEFVAGRCRPNTVRAVAFDLKVFFSVVAEVPVAVRAVHVFEFLAQQRGDRRVVRLADGESGLSARTIARRLSSVSGFYAYLVARGDTAVTANPVPRGLQTRRAGGRARTVPLVRVPQTCRRSCRRGRSTRCWRRCARRGTGRWCWRCCSAGCARTKSLGCGCPTYV
jgi:integrase/recombinase XerD